MRGFVTGASGWIGSAVVPGLIGAGGRVVRLARMDASTDALPAAGLHDCDPYHFTEHCGGRWRAFSPVLMPLGVFRLGARKKGWGERSRTSDMN
jgi:nucleoside-diphosphate-sugar epimerase